MSTTEDELIADVGRALARRLTNRTLPSPITDEAGTSSAASTNSTEPGEVADVVVPAPVITDADGAQTPVSESAASDVAGTVDVGDGGAEITDSVPSPTSIKVGDREFGVSDIERMQTLYDWATQLDPKIAQSMAAIETGQAAAVSNEDYARYQAWRTTQKSAQVSQAELLQDLDPEQLAYFEQLRLENEQLRAASAIPSPAVRQQTQQSSDQFTASFQTAQDAWTREHGLTQAQTEQLMQVALDNGAFGMYAQQERVLNPINGSVIREADPAVVTTKALNFALASDPGLYTQVMTAQQSTAARAAADAVADSAVSQKKARAASLSTAASQATLTPPVDVRKMNREELTGGMSAMIAQLEGIPQHE